MRSEVLDQDHQKVTTLKMKRPDDTSTKGIAERRLQRVGEPVRLQKWHEELTDALEPSTLENSPTGKLSNPCPLP